MFFQHTCTILRQTKAVVAGTESTNLSTIATCVPCTLWKPKAKWQDATIGRDVAMDQRDFMTATEILSGDIVDVDGFGKYLVGAVDINKTIRKSAQDNFYAVVSKHGDS